MKEEITVTEFEFKVLKLVDQFPNIGPRELAEKLWPESNIHTSVKNTGNGACSGKAAWLLAGSITGKLAKKKLLFKRPTKDPWLRLTDTAKQLIKNEQ